jgi:hypothetical protein
MKPYMIIEGSQAALDSFEKKVADALEMGYSLAGELVVQTHLSEVKFYQPVILTGSDEDEWDEEDDDEDEEDEDEDED